MIDRHRVVGAERGRIGLDHRMQTEPLADLGQDRHAKLPAAVRDHEVDGFGRRLFGGTDEVPFVFTRSSASTTTTIRPARIASTASSIVEKCWFK